MHPYIQPLAKLYQQAANPADAVFMKKYMLGQFEFFGIRSQQRKEIYRAFIKSYGLCEPGELPGLIKELWNLPQREYQYFGIELSEKLLKKAGIALFPLIEFMIVNKSWWDTVDWIASHHAGSFFKAYPEFIQEKTTAWMNSGNIWLQRTCLLFQLKYKDKTNEDLLFDFIQQLKESKEFFIRKAIGWALREYSKTAPETVRAFVEKTHLSGLSRREALKWMKRKKNI